MKYLFLLTALLLFSCTHTPEIIVDKGAVFGVLSSDAHPSFTNKIRDKSSSADDYRDENSQGVIYHDNMVNYSQLNELYVGLVLPYYTPREHHLFAEPEKMSPSSLALSSGDMLKIQNNTSSTQHFFISDIEGEGFQSFPELQAGQNAYFTVNIEGNLELLSEDNDALKVVLFSKKNMLTKKLFSGQRYQFENLPPDSYQLIFWYWRLGKIEKTIRIEAQKNIRVDETLTVDSVMRSYHGCVINRTIDCK